MQRITEHVFVFRDSRDTNLGLITTPGGPVLVDSPLLPDDARRWRAAVLSVAPGSPLYLINSDHHLGHSLGNWAFPETRAVAHRHSAFVMLEKYDAAFQSRLVESFRAAQPEVAAELERVPLPHPSLGVVDELKLYFGDFPVELIHVGGHTPGTIVVRVPEDGVVFTGDVVVTGRLPFLGDANSQQWITAMSKLELLEARHIIPGHGELATLQTLQHLARFIKTLRDSVEFYYEQGLSRKDVVAKVRAVEDFPIDDGDRLRSEQRLKASVQRIYDEFKERDKEQERLHSA